MPPSPSFLEVAGGRLEYAWHGPGPERAPTLVFLHEGLGSVSQWRGFPAALVEATGCGALVYSRFGYGGSSPCRLPRPPSYMHEEALQVLPAVLQATGVRRPILVGHSDGASIALIYAGGTPAEGLMGLLLEAPHVFVEPVGDAAIRAARQAYAAGDLRRCLARHHGENVDGAFRGWADAWTDPSFRDWNLEGYLPGIRAPMLLIQGAGDVYGTHAQLAAIARGTGGLHETLWLADCGHAPHREQEAATLQAMRTFVARLLGTAGPVAS